MLEGHNQRKNRVQHGWGVEGGWSLPQGSARRIHVTSAGTESGRKQERSWHLHSQSKNHKTLVDKTVGMGKLSKSTSFKVKTVTLLSSAPFTAEGREECEVWPKP